MSFHFRFIRSTGQGSDGRSPQLGTSTPQVVPREPTNPFQKMGSFAPRVPRASFRKACPSWGVGHGPLPTKAKNNWRGCSWLRASNRQRDRPCFLHAAEAFPRDGDASLLVNGTRGHRDLLWIRREHVEGLITWPVRGMTLLGAELESGACNDSRHTSCDPDGACSTEQLSQACRRSLRPSKQKTAAQYKQRPCETRRAGPCFQYSTFDPRCRVLWGCHI